MKKNNLNLTAEQKLALFDEETEPPGSSELNSEKREGSYHCVNCGVKLFESNTKYESGSGWPSFFKSLPDVFATKTDNLLGYQEQSIIVRIVADIMDIYLMTVQNLLVNDIVIMEFV